MSEGVSYLNESNNTQCFWIQAIGFPAFGAVPQQHWQWRNCKNVDSTTAPYTQSKAGAYVGLSKTLQKKMFATECKLS